MNVDDESGEIQKSQPLTLQRAQSLYDNPAAQYLASLGSDKSRRVVGDRLTDIAKAVGTPHWRDADWTQMDRQWIYIVRETYRDRQSPATLNACVSALKGVARHAWDMKLISADAYQRIKETRSIRSQRLPKTRYIEPSEIRKLIDRCYKDDRIQGARDCAVFALLFGLGLRRSELVGIDVTHIDKIKGTIRIIGKGNKERIAHLPHRSLEMLLYWLELLSVESGPIFVRIRSGGGVTNERLSDQAVYYLVKRWAVLAGVDGFSPHDLRGSFISYLLDHGEDISTVAAMAGHSSVTTTARYDRRGERKMRQAATKIEF